jgi:hypothetical protein
MLARAAGRDKLKADGLTHMQQTNVPTTDAAIIGRIGKPDRSDFSPETAREILSIQLSAEDQEHMQELSLKVQEGKLTPTEQSEVESYRRIGYWLGILWSKARLSLKHAGMDVPHGHRA